MNLQKGRTLVPGQLVEVYFNLHKHVFSIRDRKTKLVLAHANQVSLDNVTFHVSETGRQRTLQTKQKCVHALLIGTFVDATPHPTKIQAFQPAYYNPYQTETFIDAQTATPLLHAATVYCEQKRVYYQPILETTD